MWSPGPDAAASHAYSHWTHVAFEIGAESWASCHTPSTATSTRLTPRSGAHEGTRPGDPDLNPRALQDAAEVSGAEAAAGER